MTKLLVVSNRYPAHADDAASPFAADFVRGLQARDIDCTVVTPYHRAESYDDDIDVHRFRWGEETRPVGSLPKLSPGSWLKIARYMKAGYHTAAKLHEEKQFDFCLALWAAPSGIFARRLKQMFRLPYAVWCLGSDIHTYARLPLVGGAIREVLCDSERVYADGHQLGRQARILSGCRYSFLPSQRRVPKEIRERTFAQEKLFVCPGRVEAAKGVFDLLDAYLSIVDEHPDWALTFIGDGSGLDELRCRIGESWQAGRVEAPGFLSREEMFRLIGRARAIVIPTHADSLPLTFGEAMQMKRPVIATDVGDLPHFIEKYHVGLVTSAGSPTKLAGTLRQFITDKDELLGRYDECAEELDVERAADMFAQWLRQQMGAKKPSRAAVTCKTM